MLAVAHNLSAMNAQRQFNINVRSKAKSTEKLSSGYRINRAADDAAGLAISEKMRRQIRGLSRGVENCQDGISVCQVADGALAEVNDMLNRITQLTIQSMNDTLNDGDREAIQSEITQLTDEISRVGVTTTFNEIPIFDIGNGRNKENVQQQYLIESKSTKVGYLSEAYKVGSMYYPAAIMDFSNLDEDNIPKLYNKSFNFTCSQSCAEVFDFKFVNVDGNSSRFVNPSSKGQQTTHYYEIDIHGAKNGNDVLNAIFNYVHDNPPTTSIPTTTSVKVSHSNELIKDGDKLVIRATSGGYDPQKVIEDFLKQKKDGPYGKANLAQIAGSDNRLLTNILDIHYGPEAGHHFDLEIERMYSRVLDINKLNVLTESGRSSALRKSKKAMETINHQRAKLGAQQNRLEYLVNNENNIIENTTAAESRIRDTDMAKEMVALSTKNILEQAGISMMSQANQSNQGVLSLIQ